MDIAFDRPRPWFCIIAKILDTELSLHHFQWFQQPLCNTFTANTYLPTVQERRKCQLEYGRVHTVGSPLVGRNYGLIHHAITKISFVKKPKRQSSMDRAAKIVIQTILTSWTYLLIFFNFFFKKAS